MELTFNREKDGKIVARYRGLDVVPVNFTPKKDERWDVDIHEVGEYCEAYHYHRYSVIPGNNGEVTVVCVGCPLRITLKEEPIERHLIGIKQKDGLLVLRFRESITFNGSILSYSRGEMRKMTFEEIERIEQEFANDIVQRGLTFTVRRLKAVAGWRRYLAEIKRIAPKRDSKIEETIREIKEISDTLRELQKKYYLARSWMEKRAIGRKVMVIRNRLKMLVSAVPGDWRECVALLKGYGIYQFWLFDGFTSTQAISPEFVINREHARISTLAGLTFAITGARKVVYDVYMTKRGIKLVETPTIKKTECLRSRVAIPL